MEEKKIKLRPCPFCGGAAKLVDYGPDDDGVGDWCVSCVECGILFVPYGAGEGSAASIDEAAGSWNRRKCCSKV